MPRIIEHQVVSVAGTHPTNHDVTDTAYPPIMYTSWNNQTAPNALGHATPIPETMYGNISLPTFNKVTAAKFPSAAVVIRNLIRGNTA